MNRSFHIKMTKNFVKKYEKVKRNNKIRFAKYIKEKARDRSEPRIYFLMFHLQNVCMSIKTTAV